MRSTYRLLAASTLLLTLASCGTASPSDRQVGAIVGFSSRDVRFDSIYVSSNFAAEWGGREVAHAAGGSDSPPLEVLALIPEGMQVIDIQRADLNRDGLHDFLVVCEENPPDETTAPGAAPADMENPERVLLLLVRARDLRLRELGRSYSVIFCKVCGGMMGDPFAGISVDRRSFTVSNSGGTSWRWAEDYTFSYSRRDGNFYLDRVSRIEFDVREPDRSEEIVVRPSDFGRIAFADFDSTRLSLPWNQ